MTRSALYSWMRNGGVSGHDAPVTHEVGSVPRSTCSVEAGCRPACAIARYVTRIRLASRPATVPSLPRRMERELSPSARWHHGELRGLPDAPEAAGERRGSAESLALLRSGQVCLRPDGVRGRAYANRRWSPDTKIRWCSTLLQSRAIGRSAILSYHSTG